MQPSTRVFALLTLLFSASIASAGDPVSESWQRKTRESLGLLQRGEYEKSLKISRGVVRDMFNRLGPGNAETRSFGVALTHKALALAGLGRKEEARWDWHSALNLYPELAQTDLSPFGEPGRFLLANAEMRKHTEARPDQRQPLAANVTAPKLKKRVEPRYPGGAYSFGVSGLTVIEVLIDREGRVSSPLVLKALPAPTITWAALEALRQWKFEPGRIDGQPVDVVFNVTINFKLR